MKQQQAIQYLAFDVHQATIVANCRDADGKVVRSGHRGYGGPGDSGSARVRGLSKREPKRNLWPHVGLNDIF
jgi:hypothetical protein